MRTRFPLTRLVLIFILTLAIASPAWPNSKAYAQSNGVQGGPDTISAQDEIKADIPSFRQSDYPEIAVDAQGSIHAIWRDKPADVLDIMYSIKPAGGSWSEPVNITHNVSPALSYGARTVVDARGDIHVVVVSSDTPSANTELYYMTKPAHGGWSKAVNITNTAGCSYAPAIAVDAQNGLHVIWIDNTSGTDRGYYITKPSGGSWSIPAVISNGPGNSEQAAIAVDVQGNLHLTWYTNSSIPSKVDIIYGTRSAGGSWSKPSNISDNSGRSELPTIAVDVQGNVYVVWEDNTSGNYGILYATKSAGGSWSMPLNISRSSGTSHSPAMATDAHGTLHAAWVDGTSGNQEIMYATKPAGGSWSEPANISNNTGGSYSPAISVDIQDNVCVIWVEFVHGVHSVLFATKPAGGSWSGSPVNSHSTTTPPLTSSAVASQMPDVGAVVVNASSLAAEKAFGVVASLALDASGGGSSTYSIAASNATKTERAHADYVCSGANDRAVLNRVIALTSAKGAGIMLSSGTFNVNNWIVNKPVTIIGQGASTVIKNPDAVSHVLTRTANSGQKIVTLSSHAGIAVGDHVFFCTSGHSRIESNRVVAISGNTLTMESALTNTYLFNGGSRAWEDNASIYVTASDVTLSNFRIDGNKANRCPHFDYAKWVYWDEPQDSEGEIHAYGVSAKHITTITLANLSVENSNKNGAEFDYVDNALVSSGRYNSNDFNGINFSKDCLYPKVIGGQASYNEDDGVESDNGTMYSQYINWAAIGNSVHRTGNPWLSTAGTGFALSGYGSGANLTSVGNMRGFVSKTVMGNDSYINCKSIKDVTGAAIAGANVVIDCCNFIDTGADAPAGATNPGVGVTFENAAYGFSDAITNCRFTGSAGCSIKPISLLNNQHGIKIAQNTLAGTWQEGFYYPQKGLSHIDIIDNDAYSSVTAITGAVYGISQNYGQVRGNIGFVREDEISNAVSELLAIFGADCRGLWLANPVTGTVVYDHSANGGNLKPSAASGAKDLSTWNAKPRPTGGRAMRYIFNGTDEFLAGTDQDAYSFGDGSTDSPFTLLWYGYTTDYSATSILMGKMAVSDDAEYKEYRFETYNGRLHGVCVDNSAAARIGSSGALNSSYNYATRLYEMTCSGNKRSTGIHILVDGTAIDDTSYDAGNYVSMENTPATLDIGVYMRKGDSGSEYLPNGSGWIMSAVVGRVLSASENNRVLQILKGLNGQ